MKRNKRFAIEVLLCFSLRWDIYLIYFLLSPIICYGWNDNQCLHIAIFLLWGCEIGFVPGWDVVRNHRLFFCLILSIYLDGLYWVKLIKRSKPIYAFFNETFTLLMKTIMKTLISYDLLNKLFHKITYINVNLCTVVKVEDYFFL